MLSLCPLTVLPCSPVEQIDAAHEAGFDAIGLRLLPVMPSDIDVMADKALCRVIERRLAATGLEVLDVEVARLSPDMDVGSLLPMLRYAGDLGTRSLALTGIPKQDWKPEFEAGTIRKLAQLCEAAAQCGMEIALEFMAFRSIDSLYAALHLREAVDHPNLRICVDALHYQRSGGTPDQLRRTDRSVLSCFQICDGPVEAPADLPKEARFGRLLPGQGGIPLADMLAVLPAELPIAVEVPDGSRANSSVLERARAAIRTTRQVMAAAGRA